MKPKIWICTGGTGGHLFPALALADELCQRLPVEILFLGGGLASSRYFDRNRYAFAEIPCGSFGKKHPKEVIQSLYKISKGIWTSRGLIREQRPDLLVGFGSFFSFPPLIAAKLTGVPIVLHAADALPGQVIRLMSRYAKLTVLQFAEAAEHVTGQTAVARMPLRAGLRRGVVTREEARRALGLQPNKRTLLVFGGSQGARRMNQIVGESLLQERFDLQILHYTGDAAVADQLREAYRERGLLACVKPFENRMELAWSAADLVIARAGASTVAELTEFEVPAILIPYPYAKDQHQDRNADLIVNKIKGGIKLQEAHLTPEILSHKLGELLGQGGQRIEGMRASLVEARSNRPAMTLADLVLEKVEDRL